MKRPSLITVVVCRDTETRQNVPAELVYDPTAPCAVTMTFNPRGEMEAVWVFARDLLAAGVEGQTAGVGDVRVFPRRWGRGRWFHLALSSPDGYILLEVPVEPVRQWMARTCRVVPMGDETRWLDLDRVVAELLRGGVS